MSWRSNAIPFFNKQCPLSQCQVAYWSKFFRVDDRDLYPLWKSFLTPFLFPAQIVDVVSCYLPWSYYRWCRWWLQAYLLCHFQYSHEWLLSLLCQRMVSKNDCYFPLAHENYISSLDPFNIFWDRFLLYAH